MNIVKSVISSSEYSFSAAAGASVVSSPASATTVVSVAGASVDVSAVASVLPQPASIEAVRAVPSNNAVIFFNLIFVLPIKNRFFMTIISLMLSGTK